MYECAAAGLTFGLNECDRFVCTIIVDENINMYVPTVVDGCSFRNARKSATPALALIGSLALHSVPVICPDSQSVSSSCC